MTLPRDWRVSGLFVGAVNPDPVMPSPASMITIVEAADREPGHD
jgi:hypothetical protein